MRRKVVDSGRNSQGNRAVLFLVHLTLIIIKLCGYLPQCNRVFSFVEYTFLLNVLNYSQRNYVILPSVDKREVLFSLLNVSSYIYPFR